MTSKCSAHVSATSALLFISKQATLVLSAALQECHPPRPSSPSLHANKGMASTSAVMRCTHSLPLSTHGHLRATNDAVKPSLCLLKHVARIATHHLWVQPVHCTETE